MKKETLNLCINLILSILLLNACGKEKVPKQKDKVMHVILDTDIGGDNDDASAVAILHALSDMGLADILAMGVVSTGDYCPACLDAINTFYGRGDIPIGVIKNPVKASERDRYSKAVAESCPNDIGTADQVPDVIDVYRETLVAQPDSSVTMIAIGMMDNLVNLLNSKPDKFSELEGIELVKRKISVLYVMAPYFNEENEYQSAWNFTWNPEAAVIFLENWPTAIKFGEGNLGKHYNIRAECLAQAPVDNPIRITYEAYGLAETGEKRIDDRHASDETTVLYAIYGNKYFNETGPGACIIRPEDGFTRWDSSDNRQHYYNTQKLSADELEKVMCDLLLSPPKSGKIK